MAAKRAPKYFLLQHSTRLALNASLLVACLAASSGCWGGGGVLSSEPQPSVVGVRAAGARTRRLGWYVDRQLGVHFVPRWMCASMIF